MPMRRYATAVFLSVTFLCCASAASPQGSAQMQQVADKVIRTLLNVQPGSAVVIIGNPDQIDLTEDIAISAHAAGASTVMSLQSNRVNRATFARRPARFDGLPPKAALRIASIADDLVTVDLPFDPTVAAGVPASRLTAVAKAGNAVTNELVKRGIPTISIGNGLLPAPGTARQYGVSEAALADLFWNGLNADYARLHRDVTAVGAALQSARVHLTAPNGTNLTLTLQGAATELNDGIISAADRAKGGTVVAKQLPAGDVYYLAQPGTANGTVILGDSRVGGTVVSGLTLHFVNGVMVSHTAKSGLAAFDKLYEAAGAGRDRFSFFDLGTNRSMHLPAGGQWGPGPSMAAGYISMGVGNDLAFGGTDASAFAFASGVRNATVTVNGKRLVLGGTLQT